MMKLLKNEMPRVNSIRNEPKKLFPTPGIGSAPINPDSIGIGGSTKTGARRMMKALKDKFDKQWKREKQ
jgi:hypothetical protein